MNPSQHKVSGPEQPSFMPYAMTTMDPGTTLNKTETYDGIKNVGDYWHFRQGNPPSRPNENMHWHIAPAAKGAKTSALLATDCIQRSGMQRTGPWQHGVRDFSKNWTPEFSQPAIPKRVNCGEADAVEDSSYFSGTFSKANDPRFGDVTMIQLL